MAVQIHNYTAE